MWLYKLVVFGSLCWFTTVGLGCLLICFVLVGFCGFVIAVGYVFDLVALRVWVFGRW